jgi:hypothetical protein
MATNREYRDLNNLTPAIAATYPRREIVSTTPIYRDIVFSNITGTASSGHRAGLIWGRPEMNVSNVLLQNVTITADKPLGIYSAQNVRLVNTKIITPKSVEPIASTNSTIAIKRGWWRPIKKLDSN